MFKLYSFRFWRKWVGFSRTEYYYTGKPGNGQQVIDWQLYLGWWMIQKDRIN